LPSYDLNPAISGVHDKYELFRIKAQKILLHLSLR
jgi:hypothetical protein